MSKCGPIESFRGSPRVSVEREAALSRVVRFLSTRTRMAQGAVSSRKFPNESRIPTPRAREPQNDSIYTTFVHSPIDSTNEPPIRSHKKHLD